jgi:hypothetical protein
MTALLILAGAMAFLNLLVVLLGLFVLFFIQRDIRDSLSYTQLLASRYNSLEQAIVAIYTMIVPSGNPSIPDAFKTPDGEHVAQSFEELLKKITNDPRYKGKSTPQDMDQLKELFEEATDDDEEEKWKEEEEEENE